MKTKDNIFGDVKEFVISRKIWAHATVKMDRVNYMLESSGKQCCLGIYASACGIPADVLLDAPAPMYVFNRLHGAWQTKLIENGEQTVLTKELIEANDRSGWSLPYRQRKIRALFGQMGIKVRFTK